MKHIRNLFLLIVMGISVSKAAGQDVLIQQPELAREIRKMRDEDQKMRMKWSGMIRKGKSETKKFKELTQALIAKDRDNTRRMREIVAAYGWPTFDLVGRGPSNSAWLNVQHADRNPMFQIKCLPLLKKAVDEGQANPSNYAYLYDRVQVAKGEKQLYATQSSSNNGLYEGNFYPIEDESNVQNRRVEMNIEQPVDAYAAAMGFAYSIPTKEEAMERAQKLAQDYQENLKTAQDAMESGNYQKAAEAYLKVTQAFGVVTIQDFIAAARALSLAKHEDAMKGTSYLLKAMVRGWDGFEQIHEDPDFAFLQEISPANWADFLKTVEEIPIDR